MEDGFIHPTADVQTFKIGRGTTIWQNCVILPNARIGENCNICAGVFVENDTQIGDGVTIKNGVQIWDGLRIGNAAFVGPNVTFTNDRFPRSRQYPALFLETIVGVGASIGANSTILPGVRIGDGAMIGAGSVVTSDVPSNAIVVGNPAKIVGYDGAEHFVETKTTAGASGNCNPEELNVGGCRFFRLPSSEDMRGSLSVVEVGEHLPFVPKRCFWIFDVPTGEVRGEHAHKILHQYLICVSGSVNVILDDGASRAEVILNNPSKGLHIPPGVWASQYKYSETSVLLVLASEKYDSEDYIRDYEEFLSYISHERGGGN
jgi:UDP-2-acetamido-3-amino-2,3-dideoxy-glucuronate N-acetyltransferase